VVACKFFGYTCTRLTIPNNSTKKVAVVMKVDNERPGNVADVKRILKLLPKWGYAKVINVKNASRKDMIQTLCGLQKLEGIYHGLLVFIACHGISGNILKTSDGRAVKLRSLQELVNSTSALAFSGVPKIFIVNACRGIDRIELHQTAEEALLGVDKDAAITKSANPSIIVNHETDFFTAYSTVDGFVSLRNTEKGTYRYFAQTLLHVWGKKFDKQPLKNLMQKTRMRLMKEVNGHQVCETSETLMYPVIRGVYAHDDEEYPSEDSAGENEKVCPEKESSPLKEGYGGSSLPSE